MKTIINRLMCRLFGHTPTKVKFYGRQTVFCDRCNKRLTLDEILGPEQSSKRDYWDVMNIPRKSSVKLVRETYRLLVKKHHPDTGGTSAGFLELQESYTEALKEAL